MLKSLVIEKIETQKHKECERKWIRQLEEAKQSHWYDSWQVGKTTWYGIELKLLFRFQHAS